MSINVALAVLPVTIGRSREKLLTLLAGWAEKRSERDFAIRLSGPVEIPGKDFEVWLFETTSYRAENLLSDLSMFTRAIVLLRLNEASGHSFVRIVTRGSWTEEKTGSVDEIEVIAAHGLGAFVGALEVEPGWLAPWVAVHQRDAKVVVLRWNHTRPASTDWPRGYREPTEEDWRFFDGLEHVREGRYIPGKE